MTDHLQALPNGYRLHEYVISGVLGSGGFGITYSAHDQNLQSVVAIKEYLPSTLAVRLDGSTVSARSAQDKAGFEWGLDRFLKEAQIVAKFDHPNIVKTFRFFRQNGTGYIVMEYVEGRTLASILKQLSKLTQIQIRDWIWPIIEGLETVHNAGYLHRDIKPQNIMIRRDCRAVLLDFGAARAAIGDHTQNLTAIMTPGFAPLEQYQTNGHQGPWTDIYALGAVLHCCVFGTKPPDALDRVSEDAAPLQFSDIPDGYPASLMEGINAALSLREGNRPQSISEWLAILEGQALPQTREMRAPAYARQDHNTDLTPQTAVAHSTGTLRDPTTKPGTGHAFWALIGALPVLIVAVTIIWWSKRDLPVSGSPEVINSIANTATSVTDPQPDPKTRSTAAPPLRLETEVTHLAETPGATDQDLIHEPATASNAGTDVQHPEAVAPLPDVAITVTTEPAGAEIHIDGSYLGRSPVEVDAFAPGQAGDIQVMLAGYQPIRQTVSAPDEGQETIHLILEPVVIPQYLLTVQTTPQDAAVRILNIGPRYEPGMSLEPGRYHLEISRRGYETRRVWTEIVDADRSVEVTLEQTRYPLALQVSPADATVRILNVTENYQSGVPLLPGYYEVEVSKDGYLTQGRRVEVGANAPAEAFDLAPIAESAQPETVTQYPVVLSAAAQKCVLPSPPPPVNTNADYDVLIQAKAGIDKLQMQLVSYRNCLTFSNANADATDGNLVALNRAHNVSVEMEEQAAASFNAALQAYRERTNQN